MKNQNEKSNNNMYKATKYIVKKFDELDCKYEYEKYDDTDLLTLRYNTDTMPLVEVSIAIDESFDCSLYSFNIATVNDENLTETLELLNDLNGKYRYVKFCISENVVQAEADVLGMPDNDNAADVYVDYITALVDIHVNIIEKAYPEIMKTIWKTK